MAGPTYVLDKTYKCTVTLGIAKYLAVAYDGSPVEGEVELPSSAAMHCVGIAQEAGVNGKQMRVRKYGISKCVFGTAGIVPGDYLEVATTGKLTKAVLTAGSAAVHHIIGTAESSGGDGDEGDVFLTPAPVSVPAS